MLATSGQARTAKILLLGVIFVLLVTGVALGQTGTISAQRQATSAATSGASASTPTTQPLKCAQVLPLALKNLSTRCNNLDANQVCYANRALITQFADGSSTSATFANVGDIAPITAFKSLNTAPLDLKTGTWGLAAFKLITDVPGATKGQAVTFIMYGDTHLDNNPIVNGSQAPTPTPTNCTAATTRATYLRSDHDVNSTRGALIPANTTLDALGADNDFPNWVQVRYQGQPGWVFTQNNAKLSCSITDLPDIGPAAIPLVNAGALYFSTGTSEQAACQDFSNNGLIVKSPSGQKVKFRLNGADVVIGSTVQFTQKSQTAMTVSVIEGSAWINAAGHHEIAKTGQFLDIPLIANNSANATSAPTTAATISATSAMGNPVSAALLPISNTFSFGRPSAPQYISSSTTTNVNHATGCALLKAAGIQNPCVATTPQNNQNNQNNGGAKPTFTTAPVTSGTQAAAPSAQNVQVATQSVQATVDCGVKGISADANPAPYNYKLGQYCTTIRWGAYGTKDVFVNGQGVPPSGSQDVCIKTTTTYTVTSKCPNGAKSASVTVIPEPPPG